MGTSIYSHNHFRPLRIEPAIRLELTKSIKPLNDMLQPMFSKVPIICVIINCSVQQLVAALAEGHSLKFMSRTAEYKFLRGSPAMRPRKIYKLDPRREKYLFVNASN